MEKSQRSLFFLNSTFFFCLSKTLPNMPLSQQQLGIWMCYTSSSWGSLRWRWSLVSLLHSDPSLAYFYIYKLVFNPRWLPAFPLESPKPACNFLYSCSSTSTGTVHTPWHVNEWPSPLSGGYKLSLYKLLHTEVTHYRHECVYIRQLILKREICSPVLFTSFIKE